MGIKEVMKHIIARKMTAEVMTVVDGGEQRSMSSLGIKVGDINNGI